MLDSQIYPIIITFTNDGVNIANSQMPIMGENYYLKIQILHTQNSKDIQSIKIHYYDPSVAPYHLNEDISDDSIFTAITYSMKGNDDSLVDRATNYMKSLPPDEVSIIFKEYSKYIKDGVVLDCFIACIAYYMAFLVLNENNIFVNQIPFQFSMPYSVYSGNLINRNMFQYISLPLISLCKICQGGLLQLILFIQSFINIWEPLFTDGPIIGTLNESRMCLEIINGFSQHVASTLAQTKCQQNLLIQQMNSMENQLRGIVEQSMFRTRREIDNLLIDTRESIEDVKMLINDSIKEKISKITDTELDNIIQTKTQTQGEIESSRQQIKDIDTSLKSSGLNDILNSLDSRINDLQRYVESSTPSLIHRIDDLYERSSLNLKERLDSLYERSETIFSLEQRVDDLYERSETVSSLERRVDSLYERSGTVSSLERRFNSLYDRSSTDSIVSLVSDTLQSELPKMLSKILSEMSSADLSKLLRQDSDKMDESS